MAIFAPILAFAGRQFGRVLTTALGWASSLLFGRVPQSRQLILAAMTLGSIAWVATLVGVLVPEAGTLLLGFVPIPEFVDEAWVRLGMLVAAIVTPLLIGLGGLLVADPADRPGGLGALKQVLRGYPLALLLAFTLAFLAVVGVVRKARSVLRRWTDAHVPIVVRPGGYERLVADLEDALDQSGLAVTERPAPAVMSLPARFVGLVAAGGIGRLVPDRLTMLTARDLEISLYPSDIAISGKPAPLARARAAIASRLVATAAHLTTSKESQAVEDRLEALAATEPVIDASGTAVLSAEVRRELAGIDATLAELVVEYDEWEVLYRMRLQVERDLLAGHQPGEAVPGTSAIAPAAAQAVEGRPSTVFALAAIGLVLLDVTLALLERVRPTRPR